MKKLNPQISILILIFTIISCCKDNENQPPTCEITSPNFGDEFIQGDIINIVVEANDLDGSIKEVRFYIDDVGKSSSNSFPYGYDWNTNKTDEGSHIIKALAMDDGNLQTEDSVEIIIQSNEGEFTDSRDNKTYKWVKIGEQIWMAENLKTTKYNDGSDILNITDASTWSRFTSGAYCYYENDNITNEQYGPLYNWYAVNTGKLAPEGWHIPTDEEWSTLIDFLGGSDIAGGKMKSINGWNSPNEGATNESGFSALPGGERDGTNGGFSGLGSSGYWWSSTAEDNIRGIGLKLSYNNAGIAGFGGGSNKSRGMSIRCIKN